MHNSGLFLFYVANAFTRLHNCGRPSSNWTSDLVNVGRGTLRKLQIERHVSTTMLSIDSYIKRCCVWSMVGGDLSKTNSLKILIIVHWWWYQMRKLIDGWIESSLFSFLSTKGFRYLRIFQRLKKKKMVIVDKLSSFLTLYILLKDDHLGTITKGNHFLLLKKEKKRRGKKEKCEGHFFFFLGDGPHIQWYGTGPLPLKFNNQNKKSVRNHRIVRKELNATINYIFINIMKNPFH